MMQRKLLSISFEVNKALITKQLTVWRLDEQHWVDVYSVLKALGLGRQYLMFLKGCASMLGFDVVQDSRTPDGLLIKPALLPKLLAKLGAEPSLAGRTSTLWRMTALAQVFPQAWREAFVDMQSEPDTLMVARKVNATLVAGLFQKVKTGQTMAVSAQELGIGVSTARAIRSGTYRFDRQAHQAWLETFGGLRSA